MSLVVATKQAEASARLASLGRNWVIVHHSILAIREALTRLRAGTETDVYTQPTYCCLRSR